jgi:hypothetical protein
MRTLLALLLALLGACLEPAPEPAAGRPAALTREGERALDLLLGATRFTDDAIGYAGDTPDEVLALRVLWHERDPHAAFAHLARHGTLPGKLFGLCGLWYTDPALFLSAAAPLRGSETLVPIQMGCTGGEMPLGEILDRGDRAVRLASREQSLAEWFAARPEDAPSVHYDVAGGGYPCLFKTGGGFR